MNPKQKMFVAEYLVDRNATKAAIRAGYSERRAPQTGWELTKKPEIAAAIRVADDERMERLSLDGDALVMLAVEVIEKASGRMPLRMEGGFPEYDFTPSAALKGIEMLMKHLGIAGADRLEVAGLDGGPVVYTLQLDSVLGEDVDDFAEDDNG